jgi:type III restriction enzyme
VLFGKIKQFVETELFEQPVDLEDLNTLRNLSEIDATRTLMETIKAGVNALTVLDAGTTEVRGSIRIGKTRPFLVREQAYVVPKKSVFNKIVGDSGFELEIVGFLDGCADIVSFVKNSQSTNFRIEYRNADGGIANYYPDFIVKRTDAEIWIVETKGREDLGDPLKWERLQQWCADATDHDEEKRRFRALFVRQEDWEAHKVLSFERLVAACG